MNLLRTDIFAQLETSFLRLSDGWADQAITDSDVACLPQRSLSLASLRHLLITTSDSPVHDAAWVHIAKRAQSNREWVSACCGMALPGLRIAAAAIARRHPNTDRGDIGAEIVTGFIAALGTIPSSTPHLYTVLRREAINSTKRAVYNASNLVPCDLSNHALRAANTTGHSDLVLAAAVADGAITHRAAAIIAATRLDGHTLQIAAQHNGIGKNRAWRERGHAEQHLAAWISRNSLDR